MNPIFSIADFYAELESSLSQSTMEIRKKWVAVILENNVALQDLFPLLDSEPKTANRFLWLLSEIGIAHQEKLLTTLPLLLEAYDNLNPKYRTSFASFWYLVGVPPENEGKATDLLFQWLLSKETNVTIKSRSLSVLFQLTKQYPELKQELTHCLEDQMHKHSPSFAKKANKILLELAAL
ncbi:hypothetical protein [Flavobacterium sp. XGLA_31]|uniref:hypothetical protein n=1 Tax=Flavobacterium sp. XGLA_31 TaxID=3447666 RepID=UPI003F31C7D9